MQIGGRNLSTIAHALLQKQHYIALLQMTRVYDHPLEMLARYLLKRGTYPMDVRLKTPVGVVTARLWTHHDLLTVNEIFCRGDYRCAPDVATVVDLGSNIGISALYFLTRNRTSRVHLFEPLPPNLEKLGHTLANYGDRVVLNPQAVGTENQEMDFGYESTGRYGGLERTDLTATIRVQCREVNGVLADVLAQSGVREIDVLKVDIEGYEAKVVRAISPEHLRKIRLIVAEIGDDAPDLPGFAKVRYGSVVRWSRRG